VQKLIQDLNRVYGPENALWEADGESAGFEWLDVDNAMENIVAFLRRSPQTGREIVCVCNFSAVSKKAYRLALSQKTKFDVVINTNAEIYGGTAQTAELVDDSIDLPPLTTIWLAPRRITKSTKGRNKTSKLV
jgi:1,4-alpha-glucan branching enzyme